MSKIAHVVEGEASESDSEVECGQSPESEIAASKGCVITGEAPESDDESKLPSQATEEMEAPAQPPPQHSTPTKIMGNSLLHQKLWECNVSLRATLEGLVRHTTDIAVEKLTRADKTLLSVQESMRATNANLTLARARLEQTRAALERANCAAALPTVRAKQ